MDLFFIFSALGVVAFLGAVSPGPDFLVVSKNSLMYSRRIGIYTALGVSLATLVHVSYTIIGIGLVISQSVLLFSTIKILGAIYLMYLGGKLLLIPNKPLQQSFSKDVPSEKTRAQALREGFLTNVLNPKIAVFFVSVFSQLVSPDLAFFIQFMLGMEVAVIVGLWFTVLAFMLTLSTVRKGINRIQTHVLKIMGVALIALGFKVAFSRT